MRRGNVLFLCYNHVKHGGASFFKPGSPPLERIVMKMDWTEIVIETDADDIDRAGDIAQMVVPLSLIHI